MSGAKGASVNVGNQIRRLNLPVVQFSDPNSPFRSQPGDEPKAFCHCFFLKGGNLWRQVRDLKNLYLRSILPDGVRNPSKRKRPVITHINFEMSVRYQRTLTRCRSTLL